MDKVAIDKYLEYSPVEMRECLIELKDDLHWAVYIYSMMNDDKKITRPQLMEEFKITESELRDVLFDLAAAGLISQHAKSFKDIAEKNTYYRVTTLGENLYSSLFDVFIPKLPKGKVYKHGRT